MNPASQIGYSSVGGRNTLDQVYSEFRLRHSFLQSRERRTNVKDRLVDVVVLVA